MFLPKRRYGPDDSRLAARCQVAGQDAGEATAARARHVTPRLLIQPQRQMTGLLVVVLWHHPEADWRGGSVVTVGECCTGEALRPFGSGYASAQDMLRFLSLR